ncbi:MULTISPECIES: ABC transporter ATP-binding protein [Salibacterium]|uniref:ABC-2 type transport system ATP-binding protein n=2 Tax=Salibacterium TaxID=1884429 RepID=A0A1I4MEX3_9BACI|nr:ABC transporter ATP-binding protein [Salibacterium qingdaonense]SFM01982.1 ABC-2 type transport system ATP-binding protein [Salibacterium qingdaonense]
MTEPAVVLNGVSKQYGSFSAAEDISITIPKGELFGFLGPNGAGKTTTIKMMTGLLEPTDGTIEIGGINMWKQPLQAKKKIAYVPDHPTLYEKLTGWEYIRFIASVFGIPARQAEEKAVRLFDLFSLGSRADELIEGYSHGMKQKMALTGALLHDPDVIFLDEPTVGLDPKSAKTLKDLLRQLCDDGTTVFVSTHILEIAQEMCDRIGIIRDGKIAALGTMEELRGESSASLEDIFLELTGDEEQQELIRELAGGRADAP